MPTYAYACKDCGHAFDIRQSFSDDSLTVCPECEGLLRKKFSSVGVVFKGSGFYRTDSRSSGTATSPAGNNGSADGSSDGTNGSESGGKDKASTDSNGAAGSKESAGSNGSSSTGSSSTGSSSNGSSSKPAKTTADSAA